MSLGMLKIDSIDKGYKEEYDDWIKQLVSMYDQERDQKKLIKCYEQIGIVETGSITEEYRVQYVKWIKELVSKHEQKAKPAKLIKYYAKLIKYYEKLEKAGEQEYQYKLGMLYAKGNIEVQDLDKAIYWLKKSKANHIDGATDALEICRAININFKLGRKEVSEGNLAKAIKYYQQASEGGHHKSTKYKEAIEQNTQEVTSLIEAVKSNNVEMVETLYSFGVDLNEPNLDKDHPGMTALMWAIGKSQPEIAKQILDKDGVDVNILLHESYPA